jgi:hypothetical protein
MFVLLLLAQVNYLAIEDYLVVFEDIVAFAKYLVLQAISNYHPIFEKLNVKLMLRVVINSCTSPFNSLFQLTLL